MIIINRSGTTYCQFHSGSLELYVALSFERYDFSFRATSTQAANAKACKQLTEFISYSSVHDPRRLKTLQDAFNKDTANGLKIELFPVDSVAIIHKR